MTRVEFIKRHQTEILGLLLEASMGRRQGGEAWLWTVSAAKAVQERLGAAFDDLQPTIPDSKPAPSNGVATTQRK